MKCFWRYIAHDIHHYCNGAISPFSKKYTSNRKNRKTAVISFYSYFPKLGSCLKGKICNFEHAYSGIFSKLPIKCRFFAKKEWCISRPITKKRNGESLFT